MERRNQDHDPSEEDDRIQPGKYVDILENVKIPTKNLCACKVICDKQMKMSVVHNVLQHAWGRYSCMRVHEITGRSFSFNSKRRRTRRMHWIGTLRIYKGIAYH